MTTKEIQKAIAIYEVNRHRFVCENITDVRAIYEADVMSISKSGIVTEFEVKISRSDFKADAKKMKFYQYDLARKKDKYAIRVTPNKFYYVCPIGLIKPEEVPDYAGLIYIYEQTEIKRELCVIIEKEAKYIHGDKSNAEKMKDKMLRLHSERSVFGMSLVSEKARQFKERKNQPF